MEMSPIRTTRLNSDRGTNISSVPSTPVLAERPPSPEKKAFNDSNAYLTALATQERRVLELKEELQKAEVDLEKLKRQWAMHEAAKKRNELRQLEPLQPLTAPFPTLSHPIGTESARSHTNAGRTKLKPLSTRQAPRTVFSGSRHTKTLSLLSPQFPTQQDSNVGEIQAPARTRRETTNNLPRSCTVSDVSTGVAPLPARHKSLRSPAHGQPREDIVETGKQLVGDFREGLWTFLEDLRQATVGEDINTSAGDISRKQTRNTQVESTKMLSSDANHAIAHPPARSFTLHGKAEVVKQGAPKPEQTPLKYRRTTAVETAPSDIDEWDNWDSPPRGASPIQSIGSSHASELIASPATDPSTPRTSLRSALPKFDESKVF